GGCRTQQGHHRPSVLSFTFVNLLSSDPGLRESLAHKDKEQRGEVRLRRVVCRSVALLGAGTACRTHSVWSGGGSLRDRRCWWSVRPGSDNPDAKLVVARRTTHNTRLERTAEKRGRSTAGR